MTSDDKKNLNSNHHLPQDESRLRRSAGVDGEQEKKRQKTQVPEGKSKRQWKREIKQQQREKTKEEFRKKRKEKRQALRHRRQEKKEKAIANGEILHQSENYHQSRRHKVPAEKKIPTGVHIVIDCSFDPLMNDKEIMSLSNQITRCYSAMRHCTYNLGLSVTSFDQRLKHRFETAIFQYVQWLDILFYSQSFFQNANLHLDADLLDKFVYLTADTDEVVESLDPGYTYIIGGIVDKNRHKNLCLKKAQELGIRVGRLPIDNYIKLNSRQVLATSHVFELCCNWFETQHDWSAAFNKVLPPRKVRHGSESQENQDQENSREPLV